MPIFAAAMLPFTLTAAGAAATATGAIVSGKINSSASRDAAKLQTDAANHAADIQANATNAATAASTKANEDTLAFQREQAAQDQANWEASQQANYNQYASRSRAAQALGDTIGFHLPDPAAYVNTSRGGAPGSGGPSSAPGGSAAALKTLLDQGMNPQQAVSQFNQQYGRSTGNEAVYYDPSVHGKAAIGLPDAYLSLEPNGWAVTNRADAGGGAAAPRSVSNYLPTGTNLAAMAPPQAAPFQLRTINAFVR